MSDGNATHIEVLEWIAGVGNPCKPEFRCVEQPWIYAAEWALAHIKELEAANAELLAKVEKRTKTARGLLGLVSDLRHERAELLAALVRECRCMSCNGRGFDLSSGEACYRDRCWKGWVASDKTRDLLMRLGVDPKAGA